MNGRLLKQVMLAFFASMTVMYGAASVAQAYPVTHNQRGGSVPLKSGPSNWGYSYWIPNTYRTWYGNNLNYKFRMECWWDAEWHNGNYWSNRWFYGQTFYDGSWRWVHSSYVWYQWSVRRCW